jgi:hypothetical protein
VWEREGPLPETRAGLTSWRCYQYSAPAVQDRTDTVRQTGLCWPMSRFFFYNRTDTALAEDLEGTELPTLEAARAEAIIDLRQFAAAALRHNRPVGNCHIDIYDAAGLLLATVSVQDAIQPLLP